MTAAVAVDRSAPPAAAPLPRNRPARSRPTGRRAAAAKPLLTIIPLRLIVRDLRSGGRSITIEAKLSDPWRDTTRYGKDFFDEIRRDIELAAAHEQKCLTLEQAWIDTCAFEISFFLHRFYGCDSGITDLCGDVLQRHPTFLAARGIVFSIQAPFSSGSEFVLHEEPGDRPLFTLPAQPGLRYFEFGNSTDDRYMRGRRVPIILAGAV